MSNKDLQRVTECVSDIVQASASCRSLPPRRKQITQKVKIAGQRICCISVHDDQQPAEIFLRLKLSDCSSELIGLYDLVVRLMSLVLQYGALRLSSSAISSLRPSLSLRLASGDSVLEAADLNRPHDPGGQHDEHRQTDR